MNMGVVNNVTINIIMYELWHQSNYVIAVVDEHVAASAQSAFEDISGLYFDSLWALVHFMAYYSACSTNNCL